MRHICQVIVLSLYDGDYPHLSRFTEFLLPVAFYRFNASENLLCHEWKISTNHLNNELLQHIFFNNNNKICPLWLCREVDYTYLIFMKILYSIMGQNVIPCVM